MSRKKRDLIYHELEKISHKELKSYQKRSKDLNAYLREHYQRAASFKYCLNLLSARGGVLSETGGRFNNGSLRSKKT